MPLFKQELMEDIHLSDKYNWIAFNSLLNQGNYDGAKAFLNANPKLANKIFSANRFNEQLEFSKTLETQNQDNVNDSLNEKLNLFNDYTGNFMKVMLYQNVLTYFPKNSVVLDNDNYYFSRYNNPKNTALNSKNFVFLNIQGNKGFTGTGLTYAGEYDNNKSYSKNQVVTYNGALYISKIDNNTNNPANSDSWYLLFRQPNIGDEFSVLEQQIHKEYQTICGQFVCGERKVGEGYYKWTDGNNVSKGKIWFVIEEVIE